MQNWKVAHFKYNIEFYECQIKWLIQFKQELLIASHILFVGILFKLCFKLGAKAHHFEFKTICVLLRNYKDLTQCLLLQYVFFLEERSLKDAINKSNSENCFKQDAKHPFHLNIIVFKSCSKLFLYKYSNVLKKKTKNDLKRRSVTV